MWKPILYGVATVAALSAIALSFRSKVVRVELLWSIQSAEEARRHESVVKLSPRDALEESFYEIESDDLASKLNDMSHANAVHANFETGRTIRGWEWRNLVNIEEVGPFRIRNESIGMGP